MTWLRKKTIPGFAPRGDEVIGNTRQGQPVTISQEFWRWLSLLATRLQNNVTAAGTIQMTAAAVEPEGWLFLNGQTVDERLYPELAEIFGATAGVITLPDYTNRSPMGAGSIVALNETGGSQTRSLTAANNGPHTHEIVDPGHSHQVVDPGHLHAAIDRGHGHGLQLDSHTHEVTEVEGEEHVHGITDPGHVHAVTDPGHTHPVTPGSINVQNGSDRRAATAAASGSSTTGISIDSATTGITQTDEATVALSIEAAEAEVNGTVLKSQADIRVYKAKTGLSIEDNETGITLEESGAGEPFSLVHPVFGVNWMVKT